MLFHSSYTFDKVKSKHDCIGKLQQESTAECAIHGLPGKSKSPTTNSHDSQSIQHMLCTQNSEGSFQQKTETELQPASHNNTQGDLQRN